MTLTRFQRLMVPIVSTSATDVVRQREVVVAFFAAAHGGDFAALVAVLDPDVVCAPPAASAAPRTRWSSTARCRTT